MGRKNPVGNQASGAKDSADAFGSPRLNVQGGRFSW